MRGKIALGKYRLLTPLGAGSNAEVYLADQASAPDRPVVVKRIHPHIVSHPKFRQLFEAEVQSMANFSHPYAVQFLEASIDDPIGPCLVMEYVPGITLESLLKQQRVLDVERVGRLLGYFCHALQAAHEAGIIHRDLKPANLMVLDAGTDRESLKVMDFGFAGFAAKPHLQLAALTGRGPISAMGTPAYVSPEMIRGDTVDPRSDLYSVGVTLYEMLTGRLPFDYDYQERILNAHLKETPPPFAKVGVVDLPPGVEAAVQLALSKFPIERQQSAGELCQKYGSALGMDFWTATAPLGWEPPLPLAENYTPAPRPGLGLPRDPYQITHEFDANVPERLAAAKLRGFVEDLRGEFLSSEPGLIRIRLGPPAGPKPAGGTGLFGWLRGTASPGGPPGQEPVELALHLNKPHPSQSRLNVVVHFHPVKGRPPANAAAWRARCDKINTLLRQYLGA
jgi:serine/threonine protein kinase